MKKILLLLTLTFGLTTFGFTSDNSNSLTFDAEMEEEVYRCNYSIITYYPDGSATRSDYSTTAWDSDHCNQIASSHALRENLTN